MQGITLQGKLPIACRLQPPHGTISQAKWRVKPLIRHHRANHVASKLRHARSPIKWHVHASQDVDRNYRYGCNSLLSILLHLVNRYQLPVSTPHTAKQQKKRSRSTSTPCFMVCLPKLVLARRWHAGFSRWALQLARLPRPSARMTCRYVLERNTRRCTCSMYVVYLSYAPAIPSCLHTPHQPHNPTRHQISDATYGAAQRYVTRDRVEAMLEAEYLSCSLTLRKSRGNNTAFFAFADTVVAKAFNRANECHGWLGIKYQATPKCVTGVCVTGCVVIGGVTGGVKGV